MNGRFSQYRRQEINEVREVESGAIYFERFSSLRFFA